MAGFPNTVDALAQFLFSATSLACRGLPKEDKVMTTVANRLEAERKALEWSCEKLSMAIQAKWNLCISASQLRRFETGEVSPRVSQLEMFATVYGRTLADLLGIEVEQKTECQCPERPAGYPLGINIKKGQRPQGINAIIAILEGGANIEHVTIYLPEVQP